MLGVFVFMKRLRTLFHKYAENLLLSAGWLLICYGLGLIYLPLAWITAGIGLIALALLIAYARRSDS